MAGIADYFDGNVGITKFAQIVNMEMFPVGYYVEEDGEREFVCTGYQRRVYVGKYVEKRFYFEGVPYNIARTLTGAHTVTDVYGVTHSVNFDAVVTDGSSGTAVFENENNSVSISRISPHLCSIEVVNRTGTLEVQE